ncbi:FecR domain-containing protein [Pseudomonas schmalbachii]|uniref:FecR family protein n=1 Tax=Pseudomonas schmalbachii TaxID=2816993 RepID=A0ABS3TW62_9PSED|nr:FecR family protein [Pseudomonas schmalbachii]MBO3277900.1 FecR family protein [Pseudomonas schmalbachii]
MNGPVPLRVLDEAIAWQLRLGSGEAQAEDEAAFARWHAAHSEHARAWSQLGMLDRNLSAASTPAARSALLRSPGESRRKLRRLAGTGLSLLVAGALALTLGNRYLPVRYALADVVTHTGELREMRLPDNTLLQLNSRTAVDIRFDAGQRRVVLLSGEIMVQTAHGDARPFIVETRDGHLRALGTRFLVEREDHGTLLSVLQSAVAARPELRPDEQVIKQGQHVLVRRDGLGPLEANSATADAWTHGMLVVENVRLGELIERLGEYQPGYLGVAPAVADLRITGSFPLRNIDLALKSLEPTLPVRIERHNDWWVEVVPRG